MRSLDEFYRYIEKQEQALRSVTADPAADGEEERLAGKEAETGISDAVSENPESAEGAAPENADTPPPVIPLTAVPLTVPPGQRVRYIIRGGMTVAVPVEEDRTAAAALRRMRPREMPEAAPSARIGVPPAESPLATDEQQTASTPDYLPPLVEGQEPTLVADAPARHRKNGAGPWHRSARTEEAAAAEEPLSDGDAAALWQRIPRHIQILVSMEEAQEEVAQKYYTRGFKESRRQLIERLLDPTLTLEDTARVLGVCPTTVRRYTNRGLLPHHRTVGQQRRFRLSDVLAFMEQQQKRGMRDEG